jgi:succinate dehydrogenase / fumarate reductase membrane anchor subunit
MVKHYRRVVTGAHYGLKDWLVQRVTAVLMVIYLIVLAGVLFVIAPQEYQGWKSIFSHQGMRVATFVFLMGMFWHAWIGVRNVLMDYVHSTAVRLTVQIAVITVLLFYWVWAAEILWS